jgi:hypothetical protein
MHSSRSRSLATGMLSLIAVCGVVSCEQAVTIKGTITIPVAVQQRFTSTDRGRLVIWADDTANTQTIGGPESIYILCDPGPEELRLPFLLSKFSCAKEALAQARVFPVTGPKSWVYDGLPCGPISEGHLGADPVEAIAYGEKLVFKGWNGRRCESATAVADITVELIE